MVDSPPRRTNTFSATPAGRKEQLAAFTDLNDGVTDLNDGVTDLNDGGTV